MTCSFCVGERARRSRGGSPLPVPVLFNLLNVLPYTRSSREGEGRHEGHQTKSQCSMIGFYEGMVHGSSGDELFAVL